MPRSDVDVVVVGGGAAGVAAARRLRDAAIDCLIVEARPRLGGRAWTVIDESGFALDLGCGWLHSADRNPWVKIAQEQGAEIEKSRPPWARRSLGAGFPLADQQDFQAAMSAFFARLEGAAESDGDVPSANFLEPGNRWNGLINALSTYISGAEWDRVSAKDFDRYHDTGVNWRVVKGYGALISACGKDLPAELDCAVRAIDHRGKRLRIETAKGVLATDQVIVTIPSTLIAAERLLFTPALPEKIEAAHGLPLGLADKLFLSLERAEEFGQDTRVFGHTDRAATANYQFRPFGRPMIEVYFGGDASRPSWKPAVTALFLSAPSRILSAFLAARLQNASSRSVFTAGASIRCRSALIRMRRRVLPIAGRSSPNRLTAAYSSPAKPARSTIFQPRTAAGTPESVPPNRRSPHEHDPEKR